MADNAFGSWVEWIAALTRRGRARGWVTVDEVNRALPAQEQASELIADLLAMLGDLGVAVLDEADDTPAHGVHHDPVPEPIQRLVRRGRSRGYVTRAELLAAMPPDRVSEAVFDDTVHSLLGMGIRVVEEDQGG
jgi:Sigma-70 factor, region 1.1